MDKFESTIKPGGTMIYDPNGIIRHPERKDINIYQVDATKKASELGITKIFNMIVLGGYLQIKPVVTDEYIQQGLEKSLPSRHHHLIPDNVKAVGIGKEIINSIHKN
jgi:2-oxoglutarate ferredoxin oxidoreductase subunit gamma